MQDGPTPFPPVSQLYDDAPCGLVATTTNGVIQVVNQTFCAWIGVPANELVGKRKFQELLTMGGRIFHQTHWMPLMSMQGSLAEVKLDIRHQAGHTFPVLLNAVRRHGAGGAYDHISVAVAEDRNKYERELLAARKRADELLQSERAAQEVLHVAQSTLRQAMAIGAMFVWSVGPDMGTREFGDEVATLLGYPSPRHVTAEAFTAAIAPEHRQAEAEALAASLMPRGPSYRQTYRLLGADGVVRSILSTGHAFFREDGTLLHFAGVIQDISDAVNLRAAAEDRALFSEQMIGIVSHDLKNPLQAILMGTTLLAQQPELPADKKSRLLGNVTNAARRAKRLIEELLDFTAARLGRGISVNRQPIALHDVVSNIVDELTLAFPGRSLMHFRQGNGSCRADGDRLAQLLGNLVANAMAYGAVDGTVTVRSSVAGDCCSISVHNEGPAIPTELLPTLFDPMVRGQTEDTGVRNVGLGLFIVQAIAHAHGGEVSVESAAGAGTTFDFRFSEA
jgi:sigma-B regulation protein RsbU (phosphoserine phosphatase)